MERISRRTAFTLVDLLVVIGVIVILISILIPVAQKVRRRAETIECRANLHQVGVLMVAYTEQYNRGRFPGRKAVPHGGWVDCDAIFDARFAARVPWETPI